MAGDLFLVNCGHGHFTAGTALLDAVFDLYVQIRKLFLQAAEDFTLALVVFTESYFHVRS